MRKLGRIERTLLLIDWLLDPALRQRVAAALSKGEARNTLARAVCFNRLDKLHDPPYELQCHRASGLNLAVAARANGELAFPHPPPPNAMLSVKFRSHWRLNCCR
ncbi:Tn3 family transposase (plasmid) [Mycetohabitans rhizoxinica]|uniref:Tn3 family transposase n=1 Tax=Mycetohabitans rhizoxinica TaxID=412963 RepID=A0ABZ2PTB4_9BURK